jgi:carboxylesterase type B
MAPDQLKRDPYRFHAGHLGHIEGLTVSSHSNTSRSKPLVHYFGGLPYALPPVGPYRFRKPRPLPEYYQYGTKANPGRFTRSSAFCPQPSFMGNGPDPALWDENCLQLNIYIPAGKPEKGKGWPVFFFIHGGFLQWGTPNDDPDTLAPLLSETAFEAIIVAAAYRLNAFGFLTSKELQAEASQKYGESSGNMGFWDQRLALEWTAKNIGVFGGDAGNITVGGYSAGSHSTFQQLAHELYFVLDEKAVIRRAIMWSNSPGVQPKTLGEHQKQFDELLSALGIPLDLSAEEKLERLRSTPAKDIVAVQDHMKISEFRAVTDDAFISKHLTANINNGDFARRMKKRGLKLMNGECRDEHFLYQAWRTPSNSYDSVFTRLCADYPEAVVKKLMDHTCGSGQARKLPSGMKDWQSLFGHLYANMQVHDLERGFQNALVNVHGGLIPGQDLFRYRFEWRTNGAGAPPEWGVTHGTDLAIWFWGRTSPLTQEEKEVLRPWNEAFAQFVKDAEVAGWETQRVDEARRLTGEGKTDVWRDERWEEGVEVWELVNGDDKGSGVIGWLRSKL